MPCFSHRSHCQLEQFAQLERECRRGSSTTRGNYHPKAIDRCNCVYDWQWRMSRYGGSNSWKNSRIKCKYCDISTLMLFSWLNQKQFCFLLNVVYRRRSSMMYKKRNILEIHNMDNKEDITKHGKFRNSIFVCHSFLVFNFFQSTLLLEFTGRIIQISFSNAENERIGSQLVDTSGNGS